MAGVAEILELSFSDESKVFVEDDSFISDKCEDKTSLRKWHGKAPPHMPYHSLLLLPNQLYHQERKIERALSLMAVMLYQNSNLLNYGSRVDQSQHAVSIECTDDTSCVELSQQLTITSQNLRRIYWTYEMSYGKNYEKNIEECLRGTKPSDKSTGGR